MRQFDTETLRLITAFENISHTEVRDCIKTDIIYFLINTGKVGLAIGKNGITIKTAEQMLGKRIKIFEFSQDEKEFIKNLIPQTQQIDISEQKARIKVSSKDKGVVIGKDGANIKILRQFLERNSRIKELKIV